MQIELLRMSSAGLTPVEVFSTVFVVPLVVHGCIKTNGTKVTHNFLIGALDDAVRLFRVSCGEGMLDLRQTCKLCIKLIAEGRTLVSVYDVGCSDSTEVLEDAPGSLGDVPVVFVGNSSTQRENASIITRIWV